MSPKKRRPENRGLPVRWQYHHGAYYYRVPPGQEADWGGRKRAFLGRTLAEAYQAMAEASQRAQRGSQGLLRTFSELLDRYAAEEIPKKRPSTRDSQYRALKPLRAVFGELALSDLKPPHVYRYLDERARRGAETAGHREVEVLSHALTKAVEWGAIERHPIKGQVTKRRPPPRERYVEDWEVHAVLSLPSARHRGSVRMLQAYVVLKLMLGLRRGDLLRLRIADLRDDGIHVRTSKTGRRVIYAWTDELRQAVEACKAARPVDLAPWLFCTAAGDCYLDETTGRASGWSSMWQRFMRRCLAETALTERFTDTDLRAKTASDADSLEHARGLLAHLSPATTQRVYRRGPERVLPGRKL
jgi:integrase